MEVSLFHTMADWMNVPYLQTRYGGKTPPRLGMRHPTIAPYGAFRCRDGREVLLSIQNDREWTVFAAQILGDRDLATDPRYARNVARVAHMAEIEAMIRDVMATMDREDAVALLTRTGIACGRLSTTGDLADHPQAWHIEVATPTGPVEMMGRGVRFSDGDFEGSRVPALGEHSAGLRAEFHSRRGRT